MVGAAGEGPGVAFADDGSEPNVFATDRGSSSGAGEDDAQAHGLAGKFGDEKIAVDILADKLKDAESERVLSSMKSSALQYRADTLAARIPEQQERSDNAARNLYKMQRNRFGIMEMLMGSQSIDDFVRQIDYLHDMTQANARVIKQASELASQVDEAQSALETVRDAAEQRVSDVREELAEAQADRVERAAAGVAEAQRQAVELGGKNSVDDSSDDASDTGKVDKGKTGDAASKSSAKKKAKPAQEQATTETEPLDAGVDWTQSKEEFVAEWAPRLDAYLQGSPLYGQGASFAKSAWKWCIDPRWSAAISNTESTKGSYCIRPYNAWGWGAADSDPYNLAAEWGSWEEAIDAHARGLSEGYGYTITMNGARAYCPNTWQGWYNRTLAQMAMI